MNEPPAHEDASGHRATVQELVDLVLNPQDPGYEEAARRHGGTPARRWYDRPLVALGALLIGFVLVVAYVHTHRGAPEAAKVHDSLVDRVRAAQHDGDQLAARAAALDRELSELRSEALGGGALSKRLAREQSVSGLSAVRGPGLQVTISDPPGPSPSSVPGRAGTEPIGSTHILTDRDVRSIVNQLWADGAEAVAVNGVRLTPTSAIRFAGQVVLVDLQPITSPYKIQAIGPADQLATGFAASAVASRYQTLAGAEGIGFSFRESRSLSLPAGTGEAPRYATPLPSGSPR